MFLSIELDFIDIFEHFLQVGLNSQWLFCLGQYLKELVVAQKEKSCKFGPLTFKVIVQRFLYVIEAIVVLFDSV